MRAHIRFVVAATLVALIASTAPAPAQSSAGGREAGYWLADALGRVESRGAAGAYGGLSGTPAHPVVAIAGRPGGGYWLGAEDGGVFSFGGAPFLGSIGGRPLNRPIVAMAATPTGRGYWLAAADGGIFSFGDARFHGSTGGVRLRAPITGMAATPTGRGYWLVAADGGIFSFGDAEFRGSTGGRSLNRPVVGMAATPTGKGYWFVASDGGVFSFGDARFYGSTGGQPLNAPISAMSPSPTGAGYWLVASDGGVFTFGDAPFLGSTAAGRRGAPVIGMALAPDPGDPGVGIAPAVIAAVPGTTPALPGAPDVLAGAGARSFAVGLVGDTGYTSDQARDFLRVRDHMNRLGLAFTVHDGDIWSGATPCSDGRYLAMLDVFNGFAHPVIYTPGDNEWADCRDPDAWLAHLRHLFFDTGETLGNRRFAVTRQYPTYVENARWAAGGVVFATVNVPGSTGQGGSRPAELQAAGVEWLNATFDDAVRSGSSGVMVIWQDNPFASDGSDELVRTLQRRTQAFGKPVVLVHGDTHSFRIDHPWRELPQFTRVETFASGDSDKWVRVTVDPDDPNVFSFDVMTS